MVIDQTKSLRQKVLRHTRLLSDAWHHPSLATCAILPSEIEQAAPFGLSLLTYSGHLPNGRTAVQQLIVVLPAPEMMLDISCCSAISLLKYVTQLPILQRAICQMLCLNYSEEKHECLCEDGIKCTPVY